MRDESIFTVWLSAVRAKIIGKANEALITQNIGNYWEHIRARLILVFGDKRDISTLCQGISILRQGRKSLDEFYNEVTSLNTDISQKVRQDQEYHGHHAAVMHFVEMLTRNAFIDGLNEPYSLYTRNYRPQTLEEAFRAAQEQMLADSRKKERFPSQKFSADHQAQKPRNQNQQKGNQSPQNQSRNSGGNFQNSRNFQQNSGENSQPRNFQNSKNFQQSAGENYQRQANSRNFNGNFQQSSSRAAQNQNVTPIEVDTSVALVNPFNP